MNCPVCKTTKLVISDRQGVEIDYCPDCRGVWLDRGELDKIIEKSNSANQNSQPSGQNPNRVYEETFDRKNYQNRKKGSFLGELFDF